MAAATPEATRVPFEAAEQFAPGDGLLRLSTAGSVDDGKSTLIGRLLYDSRAVYEDQLASVRKSKINRASGPIDFSLLTDGLRAEREQGITIDVAYRYFSTARRKFIIADTPGHEQYTRNMATGASTADAAVVLIDATKGLLRQSRRHAYIAALLGVSHIVAAVNKMDLVCYSEEVFDRIASEFCAFTNQLRIRSVYAMPVSALEGDNVVRRSLRAPWFDGPSLLEYLETLPARDSASPGPLRFPIQYVIRPGAHFRGFAGRVASGVLRRGMSVMALPAGLKTRVKSIMTFDGELEEAGPGSSISVTLEDEIDISRGDMLVAADEAPSIGKEVQAMLVWMDPAPLNLHKVYLLKHTTRTVRARIRQVRHRVDINSLEDAPAAGLEMNEIGAVGIQTALPLFFDAYRENRTTGSFILIDPLTSATLGAGVIEPGRSEAPILLAAASLAHGGRVTQRERALRWGHPAVAVWLRGRPRAAELAERALFDEGWHVQLIEEADFSEHELKTAAKALSHSGSVAVFSRNRSDGHPEEAVRALFGPGAFFGIDARNESDEEVAARIVDALRRWRDARVETPGERE